MEQPQGRMLADRRGGRKGAYTDAISAAGVSLEDMVVLQNLSTSAFLPGESKVFTDLYDV